MPEITKQIGGLAHRVHKERVKNLERNEKYIANGFESSDDDDEDDEDDEDFMEGEQETKNKLKAFKNGQPAQGGDGNADDDDDDSDSDFEDAAGEFALYDSPLEMTDELVSIKETLDGVYQTDPNAYQFIVSTQTEEEKAAFLEIVGKAEELKQREAVCREAYEKHEVAQKIKSVKT